LNAGTTNAAASAGRTAPRIRRLALIGVGLIGGSLARALRAAGAVERIAGCTPDAREIEAALELGVIDEGSVRVAAAVEGCDLAVVAVPVRASAAVFAALAPALAPEAVVTDVGSVKASVIADARATLGPALARFVPGHPVVGTEHSGVRAGFQTLFRGHRVILTPTAQTAPAALARVSAMWRAAGAVVEQMDPGRHDALLAAVSHLPHVLAYTLVDSLAGMEDGEEAFRLAAGGFRDFTRIASSNPRMWCDILLANREAVLAALVRFERDLQALVQALRNGDEAALMACFERAKAARDACAAHLPPAGR